MAVNRAGVFAVVGMAALLFLSQGIDAPFTKDQEPQSAGWLRDVAVNGHWLVAHDDYGYVNRKPPLYYWLSALAVRATGGEVNEINARVVSLAAGAVLAGIVALWSRAYLGAAEAWLAPLFLLGCYGFASRATAALTDMLLSLLLFVAYCLLYPQIEGRGSNSRAAVVGTLLGLAILTKGPVAIALIALAASIYLMLGRRRPWEPIREPWPWIAIAIAVAIAACWYIPALIAGGRDLFVVYVQEENLGHLLPVRFGGTGEAARPFYYIAARMIGGAMPLALLLPALVVALWTGGFDPEARRPILFQLSLPLAVLALFSVASSKRDDYVLPAMPGLAIALAALFARRYTPRPGMSGRAEVAASATDLIAVIIAAASAAAVLGALVFFRLGGTISAGLQSSDAAYVAMFERGMMTLAGPFGAFTGAVVLGAIIVFVGFARRAPVWNGAGLGLIGIAGVSLFAGTLRPDLARVRTVRGVAEQVHRRIGNAPIFVLGGSNYEFSFYYGRGVPVWTGRGDPAATVASRPIYVAATPRDLDRLDDQTRLRLRLVMGGDNVGGGGPLSLYQFVPLREHH
ncbi:MAG: glycosyltransferase family 39 protein [Candidatus Binataceae bacterium]